MTDKRRHRLLTVARAWHLTPGMIRVTFAGKALEGFPEDREGANCKLLLPEPGETHNAFAERLNNGPPPVRRTYTVRHFRPELLELDIDFVDHGDTGPASAWARAAKPGDFLGFAGPGPVKVAAFGADFYLLAADMSAIPVVAATLEAMPRDARGLALFDVPSDRDIQQIAAPDGVELRWLIQRDAHHSAQAAAIRAMDWPAGRVQTCIAGEHGTIRDLKDYLIGTRQLPKGDAYISGYWKIGLVEDDHQALKRSEAA
ncbi:MAG: siderophore-interacting protein [Pseudooceanicola sp.]|nr:siderophore-interacting protein [Pseudooceanicola sp.]